MRRIAGLGLGPLLLACTAVLIPVACSPASEGTGTPPDPCVPLGASPGQAAVLAHPPADPGAPPPAANDVAVFAIRTLWMGDLDPATGAATRTAWQSLGFDLDGKATTTCSTDVCTLAAGSSRYAQEDGRGGRDSSFGENIVPIIGLMYGGGPSGFGGQAQESIDAGLATDLLVIHGLGAGADASHMATSLVVAAPLGSAPTWSTQDVWPVDASSLANGDPSAPLLAFASSFVTGGVFVAEPPSGDGEISLGVVGGAPLVVPIRHVEIAMTLSPDGMTAKAGTIAGVLPTGPFLDVARRVTHVWGSALCMGSAWLSVAQQLEQSQDVALDGTNAPGEPCTGISIGLGFEAVRVQMGAPVDVAPLGDGCTAGDGGAALPDAGP